MRIHLLEPLASGHRMAFVKRIADAAIAAGHDVAFSSTAASLAHPSAATLPAMTRHVIAWGDRERQTVSRGLTCKLGWRRIFQRHWAEVGSADAVAVLPFADYCLPAIGLLGSPFATARWVGVTMQPTFHHHAVGVAAPRRHSAWLQARLLDRAVASPTLLRLFALDETLVAWARPRRSGQTGRLVHLGDPANPTAAVPRSEARVRLGLDAAARVILVYGAVNPRKGLAQLAAAVSAPEWPADAVVLVLGAWDASARPLLEDAGFAAARMAGRIIVHDRWATAQDEADAFAAADLVWLGYVGFYQTSGVLMQAATAKLPVVACRDGLIGWLTARHQLGAVVDPCDPRAICTAVSAAARGPAAAAFTPPNDAAFGSAIVSACQEVA